MPFGPILSHHDLIVWRKSMRLYIDGWRLARKLPVPERFDLAPQLRRATLSVPSNIAEGFGRDHLGDYLHHLSMARGSVFEVDTQLLGLRVLTPSLAGEASQLLSLGDEISRMLAVLSRQLRTKSDGRLRSKKSR